jgi:hypothetical protein
MTNKERAFRRGYQQGYAACVNAMLTGATREEILQHEWQIKEWRENGRDLLPPYVTLPRPFLDLDEEAEAKLDEANPEFGSGKF